MVAGVSRSLKKILSENLSKKILVQYEQKLHKLWFDECSKLSEEKKADECAVVAGSKPN